MIDHAARTEVRQLVDEFLSDRIGAFAFDDKLFKVSCKSKDQTVRIVVRILWNAYSDLETTWYISIRPVGTRFSDCFSCWTLVPNCNEGIIGFGTPASLLPR